MKLTPLGLRSGPNHIPTLDGLRAIAILLVIASHIAIDRGHEFGVQGVAIFFALSGFLITYLLIKEHERSGRISFKNFYIRRCFRILPAAFFYLAVLSLLVWLKLAKCDWYAIRAALLFYENYLPRADGNWLAGHFWSLSIEEHFYLIWPMLLVWSGVKKGWRTAAVFAFVIIAWRTVDNRLNLFARLFHEPLLARVVHRTDLAADTLLWGCLMAFVFHSRKQGSVSSFGAAAVALLAAVLMTGPALTRHEDVLVVAHFLPAVLVVSAALAPTTPLGRFLELRIFRAIGELSYSLYLWQQMFLGVHRSILGNALALAAVTASALFSFEFIEQPMVRLGRRFQARNVGKPTSRQMATA